MKFLFNLLSILMLVIGLFLFVKATYYSSSYTKWNFKEKMSILGWEVSRLIIVIFSLALILAGILLDLLC